MTDSKQREIFNEWLKEHRGILFKIILAYAFNDHDQEDLFQEISLNLWQSIPDFRGESKPSTWIYRVALYSATVWARKERNRSSLQPLTAVEHTLKATNQPFDERLEWLYTQIAQLDPLDRSVCLLLLEGFSYKEMAAIIGITESHVGVKIHRIKKHLVRKSQEMEHHAV